MKAFSVAGVVLFLATQSLCQAHAMELCEPRDYYNLADSSKCSVQGNKAGNKDDSRQSVFEILKNYPYEQKERFVKVLKGKIELLDSNITQRQGLSQTEKVKTDISTLERAKQGLSEQVGMVQASTQDNWVGVRDRARETLEEAAKKLREVN